MDYHTDAKSSTYVQNGVLLIHTKEWNNTIGSNMDGPRGHHTKVKSNIQRQTAHDVTLMWNLKKIWFEWACIQNRIRPTDIENKFMVTKQGRRRGINFELGINIYTLEKGMATHSSVFAWRIPWQRSLVGYSPWSLKASGAFTFFIYKIDN